MEFSDIWKFGATWEPNKVRNNPNFDAFDILSSPFPEVVAWLDWAREVKQNQQAPEDQPPKMQMPKTDYREHIQFVVPKGYDFIRPIWNRKVKQWIEPMQIFQPNNNKAMGEIMKQDGVKWLGMRNNSTRMFHVYNASVLDKNDWKDIYRYSYSPSSPSGVPPFDGPPSPLKISLKGLVSMIHSDSSLKHADKCSCPYNTDVCAEKAYDWYKELADGTE